MAVVFHNVTISSPLTNDLLRFCSSWSTGLVTRSHSASSYAVTVATTVIIIILSPLAVVGNGLIMAVIWKNKSLRTPSYILLWGLAFTDIFTGLITQPFYVTGELICLQKPHAFENQLSLLRSSRGIVEASSSYFSFLTIILIALMSIERWLHMTRRSLLSVRRTGIIVTIVKVLLIPFAVLKSVYYLNGNSAFFFHVAALCVFLVCLLITSIAYFQVYQVIRHHQQQIKDSQPPQNFGGRAINLAKYRKSVLTVLYILVVFYICFVPSFIMIGLFLFSYRHSVLQLFYSISTMFWLMSSSLNPLIYLWRMKDIRNGVKNLLRPLLCQEN